MLYPRKIVWSATSFFQECLGICRSESLKLQFLVFSFYLFSFKKICLFHSLQKLFTRLEKSNSCHCLYSPNKKSNPIKFISKRKQSATPTSTGGKYQMKVILHREEKKARRRCNSERRGIESAIVFAALWCFQRLARKTVTIAMACTQHEIGCFIFRKGVTHNKCCLSQFNYFAFGVLCMKIAFSCRFFNVIPRVKDFIISIR